MVLCCSECLWFIYIFLSAIFVKQEAAKRNSIEGIPPTDIYIQEYVEIVSNVCPYSDFCTREAQSIYYSSSNRTQPCCKQCSCNQTCIFQHNCCIDAPISAVNYYFDIIKYMSCSPDSINFESSPKKWKYYYMVDSCPLEDGTELSCIKTENNKTTPADLVFVSSRDGLVTYLNEECARCHNVTDFIRWRLSVAECDDDLFKLKVSGSKLLEYVMVNCLAFCEPPAGLEFSPTTCKKDVIPTCSSEWDISDLGIAELCEVFPAPPVSQSIITEIVYKNVFCLLCNFPNNYTFRDTCLPTGTRDFTNFGYILNLNLFDNGLETYDSVPGNVSHDKRCLESEIMDPYFAKCRPLTCPFQATPKFGTCHQLPFNVKDPVLALSFIIVIQEDVSTTANEMNTSQTIDINEFLLLANITSCDYVKYTTKNYISKLNGFLRYIHLNIYLLQTHLCAKSIIEYIYHDPVFSTTNSFQITLYGLSIVNCTVELFIPFTDGNVSSYDVLPDIESYDIETFNSYKTKYTYYYGPIERLLCPSLFLTAEDFLNISSQYETQVRLQKSTFNLPQRIGRFISKKYYINGEPKYLHFICLKDYMPSKFLIVTREVSDLTKGIVTLVFASTSMVCIIVCIAVFSLTGNKRSFPSKVLQMALCNLLLAQAFFQFGVERTNLPYPLCLVIGMLVHYFWLTTVFSLNAFCVVVATKLSAINYGNRVRVSAMLKVLLYIYVLPCLFVGANITYSKSVRGKFGYGETLCYIDEAVMRGFLFAVPIIFIVLVNCFVYFYIVYKTRATSAMAGRKSRDMKYATVYFRLLLLTGVSWVFGFLNELYSSDILQYCFIVTTAGQGIFLVFAFYFGQIRSAVVKLTAQVIGTFETSHS